MRPAWSSQFDEETLPRMDLDVPTAISPDWAWGGATGVGVDVAVIDSGIDATHPAIGHVEGWIAFESEGSGAASVRAVEGPHEDLFGHGTACAGIIRRVAPEANLHSVRVLGKNLKSRGTIFAEALRWAIDAGMHAVNLSLSSRSREYFGLFHELADRAYFANTVLVSAIANTPVPSFPSEFAAVISVAAHAGSDPFSIDYNPRGPVEFGAPGIDVEVPWRGGGTIRTTGNSFAAAHVTGLVARLLSKHPGLTAVQVKAVLQALARNVSQRTATPPAAGG